MEQRDKTQKSSKTKYNLHASNTPFWHKFYPHGNYQHRDIISPDSPGSCPTGELLLQPRLATDNLCTFDYFTDCTELMVLFF